MTDRLELPDGEWVQMRPATNGGRRKAWMASEAQVAGSVTQDIAFFDALLADMVLAWSFELPVPAVDPGALDALPYDAANALYGEVRKLLPSMYPDFSPAKDTDSPSGPSSGS